MQTCKLLNHKTLKYKTIPDAKLKLGSMGGVLKSTYTKYNIPFNRSKKHFSILG